MFVQRDGVYLVNGLNSHRPQNNTQIMNTPYFGDNMLKMAEWIRNNGGGER